MLRPTIISPLRDKLSPLTTLSFDLEWSERRMGPWFCEEHGGGSRSDVSDDEFIISLFPRCTPGGSNYERNQIRHSGRDP